MKILIQIVMLCTLIIGAAYAEQAPVQEVKTPAKSASEALDRDTVCTRCHDETDNKPILSIYQTPHGNKADSRTPSCQSCHGQSDAHINGDPKQAVRPHPDVTFAEKSKLYPPSPASERNGQCLTCHQSGFRAHWTASQHDNKGVACNSCHTVHAPKDKVLVKTTQSEVCFTCHKSQRAEAHLFSTHPILAGKTACSDCHNPHGSTGPKLLIQNSTNETCYTCHSEKRGPFLWEHSPVFDNCNNCHTPHGSNSSPLLKQRVPWLCQQCHTGFHANTVNSGANLIDGDVTTINGQQPAAGLNPRVQANARACLNCHTMIHGSNHPAGAKFHR
jgi:DmsE family decaheme c-type cytochrome